MNSWYHAKAAAKRWGGTPENYLEIETFIDSSKAHIADARHRAMYHHSAGVFLCARIFGDTITVQRENGGVQVPVRLIAEQHIIEDLGWIPSPNDYWQHAILAGWMSGAKLREEPLSAFGLTAPDGGLAITKTGRVLTEVEIEELANDAAGGYDISRLTPYQRQVRQEMNERATFTSSSAVAYRELTDDEEAAENATWD